MEEPKDDKNINAERFLDIVEELMPEIARCLLLSELLPEKTQEAEEIAPQKASPFREAEVQCSNSSCQRKAWMPWDERHSSQCSACQNKVTYTGYGR